MITGTLIAHPDSPPNSSWAAIEAFSAQLSRSAAPGRLTLRFRIDGDIGQLLIPGAAAPGRQDDLWKHTCFEVFLKVGGTPAYYEFNFSPSGAWAAYRFDGYRSGMGPAEVSAPSIATQRTADRFDIDVDFALPHDIAAATPQPLSLTAVIEDRASRISYWAVAHAPLKPDFHHDNGFVLRLPSSDANPSGSCE